MSEQSERNAIGGSLVTTLAESDLASVLKDVGELTLDSVLEEGVLQDLPVVATLTGIWKTGRSIRELLFLKKLMSFLIELKNIDPGARTEMIKHLEEDECFTQRVGESVILLLERLDHLDKPTLVGRAFRAYCSGFIDAEQLQKMNQVIDRAFMPDLQQLERYLREGGEGIPAPNEQGLAGCGLAWSAPGLATTAIRPTGIFDPFVKHVLLS
ncbi:MAG: hypothetical protein OEM59_11020 [Rhodospirillales bacterium]|nr:hypothetical protein [Rhodospirillales bacterium]